MTHVSVIMPVHNRADLVAESIQSIQNQTLTDWELIVIDDASQDHTVEVVKRIQDERIRLVEMPTKTNLPMLRNYGFDLARGEYIAFMDSDDISVPERLQVEAEFLDANPDYGVVSGNYQFFGGYDKFYDMPKGNDTITNSLLFRSAIANGASMFRRSLVTELGVRMRPHYYLAEDYAFWVDLMGKTKMENLDLLLLRVRSHDQQITMQSWTDPGHLRFRKLILDEIHRTAFENMNIVLSEGDLTTFNRMVGDANRNLTITADDLQDLRLVFDKILAQSLDHPHLKPEILQDLMQQNIANHERKLS